MKSVTHSPRYPWFVLLSATVLLSGCATSNVQVSRSASFAQIRRVAVLPFTPPPEVNAEQGRGVSEGVSDIVAAEIMRRGWQVVERTRIKQVFEERHLNLGEMPAGQHLEEIRALLGADAFVAGAVTEWRGFKPGLIGVSGAVALTLKMYDARTGECVYSGSDSRQIGLMSNQSQTYHAEILARNLCARIPGR